MAIVLLICLSLWLAPQLAICADSTSSTGGIPPVLFRPFNDSLTEINLLLDDTQKQIHDQQALSIPVLIEMNRSIGDQGPFDSHLAVSPKIYTRFLTFIDTVANNVGIQMTQLYLRAINLAATTLSKLLKADKAAETVKLLKFVIFEIAPKIGLVTAENKARYWAIYEWVAVRLVNLQTKGSPNEKAYNDRLEYVLGYGVENVNRYINDVGNRVNEFAEAVRDKLVAIIKEALSPSCERVGTTVEPFVRDNFDL